MNPTILLLLFLFTSGVNCILPDEGCYVKRMAELKLERGDNECSGMKNYKPWAWTEDENCDQYQVGIASAGTFEPTALVSFPCSGSALFRELIERMTGWVTGSIQPSLPDPVPEYELRCELNLTDGKSIAQATRDVYFNMMPAWLRKTLSFDSEQIPWTEISKTVFGYRGILLIRNPWYAMICARSALRVELRLCNDWPTQPSRLAEPRDFNEIDFTKFFKKSAIQWVKQTKTWIENSPHDSDMIIVQYENLVKNPEPELRRVLKYLNVTFEEERYKCISHDQIRHYDPLHHQEAAIKSNVTRILRTGKGSRILQKGISEINTLLQKKGINAHLDYRPPTESDLKDGNYILRGPSVLD